MAVIKGKIRGNGGALASYVMTQKDNEHVRILDVDGQERFTEQDLRDLLRDMSRNEQITMSRKGIYHAIINPSEETSQRMKDEDWLKAADILSEELGFDGQRRVIVLHQKLGRQHGHLIMERYDHEKEKMIGIAHNYKAHDRARRRIEAVLNETPTPVRNPHRPAMKATLTGLWNETQDARGFVQAAKKQGYVISKGFDRTPFMAVDATGRSFNLVRHLDGVKLKEVRERLKGAVLMEEKDAIAFARTAQHVTGQQQTKTAAKDKVSNGQQPHAGNSTNEQAAEPSRDTGQSAKTRRDAFAENLAQQRQQRQQRRRGPGLS